MNSSPIQSVNVRRRDFLRFGGACAVGSSFFGSSGLLADSACEKIDSTIDVKPVPEEIAGTLQYWIDGLHLGDRSNIKSRANIAVFMNLKQRAEGYVESIAIIDDQKRVLGARYFDVSAKMVSGHVPYAIFENITLDSTKTYKVVYRYVKGQDVILYSADVSKPALSRLNPKFLPKQINDDFSVFLLGSTANPTPGLVTTQFQFYTVNGLSAHTARGRMLSLDSKGAFTLNIDFMHGDLSETHYMRYFMVLDPVGRLLGVEKREFGDPSANGGAANTWNVAQLSKEQIVGYGLPDDQIANILDCPYVQIYTEDSYDAMARSTLRMR